MLTGPRLGMRTVASSPTSSTRLPGAAMHHWYEDLGIRTATTATMQGLID